MLENSLDVPEVVHEIRQNDVIELLVKRRKIVGIRMHKLQVRILFLCAANHFFREIDPHSTGRHQRSEQVSLGTAYFEDVMTGVNMKTVYLMQTTIIPSYHSLP